MRPIVTACWTRSATTADWSRSGVSWRSPTEAPSRLRRDRRYILLPQVFDHLSMQQKGAGGEIQLTDAMAR